MEYCLWSPVARFKVGMFSWFPMFFPLRHPQYLRKGSIIRSPFAPNSQIYHDLPISIIFHPLSDSLEHLDWSSLRVTWVRISLPWAPLYWQVNCMIEVAGATGGAGMMLTRHKHIELKQIRALRAVYFGRLIVSRACLPCSKVWYEWALSEPAPTEVQCCSQHPFPQYHTDHS